MRFKSPVKSRDVGKVFHWWFPICSIVKYLLIELALSQTFELSIVNPAQSIKKR